MVDLAVSYVHEFWRDKITTLPEEELEQLGKEITLGNFTAAVKEALGGKDYALFSGEAYTLKDLKKDQKTFLDELQKSASFQN